MTYIQQNSSYANPTSIRSVILQAPAQNISVQPTLVAPSYNPSLDPSLNINSYVSDGFEKVCDVVAAGEWWEYININRKLMFSNHKSWVYFIVDNDIIKKVGETGNPLGLEHSHIPGQVRTGTMSRFGRYMRNGDSDLRVREGLFESVKNGTVSLWAKMCPFQKFTVQIQGTDTEVNLSFHKDLELAYLDHIYRNTGSYPEMNACRK